MPFRMVEMEYSEVADFSVKGVLDFTYGAVPGYKIDGATVGVVSDLGGPTGLRQLYREFVTDSGATDLTKRTGGGVVVTRSGDLASVQIAGHPYVPWGRFAALDDLLASLGFTNA
jgi:hypothetical protein